MPDIRAVARGAGLLGDGKAEAIRRGLLSIQALDERHRRGEHVPFLTPIANEAERIENFGKGLIAGALGLPGDLAQFAQDQVASGTRAFQEHIPPQMRAITNMPLAQSPQVPFSSDAIVVLLGGDVSDPATQLGLLGAPDPSDLTRIAARGGEGLINLGMTLFHGTPHRFDRFSLDSIGTGEGAQAFGHGLYFAENPGVARSYQTNLSPGRGTEAQDVAARVMEGLEDTAENRAMAVAELQRRARSANDPEFTARMDEAISVLEGGGFRGHLYEVEIPDEVTDRMLDWDAPLSEQPESVRRALNEAGIPTTQAEAVEIARRNGEPDWMLEARGGEGRFNDIDGQTAYQNFARELGGQEAASAALAEAGIPGIRFFDGSSRSAGEGTRNIVVFNPDDITQVKRDGEVVFGQ